MNNNAIKLVAVVVTTAGLAIVTPSAMTSAEVLPAADRANASTETGFAALVFHRPRPCAAWRCPV
jgi:hypothetical protein